MAMARLNSQNQGVLCSILICFSPFTLAETPLSSASTQFTASILDGSCDWAWDNTVVNFPVVTPAQIMPAQAIAIKPLQATIECNQAGLTPQLMVTGNTPYPSNEAVFLDSTEGNGVGFMLQMDSGAQLMPDLDQFYRLGMAGKAMVNQQRTSAPSMASDLTRTQQIIWVGLVGMQQGSQAKAGKFSSVITLTGLIP